MRKRGIVPRCNSKSIIGSSRKGQVTVFIIIGIVVLFVTAGILFVSNKVTTNKLNADGTPIIEDLPTAFQPLQLYTESCLEQVGKKGLLLLGEQGGYIYPDVAGTFSSSNPTNADGIDLEPAKVPYWHYNQQPNEGSMIGFQTLQPSLSGKDEFSVEAQLSRFMEEKIEGCLAGFDPFAEQGFIVSREGEVQVDVTVAEQGVHFLLEMPMEIQKGDASADAEQFFVNVPLELKKYYSIANDITQAEKDLLFLERQGLDLLHLYSEVDENKLPPVNGIKFDMVPTVYWNTEDVKGNIQQMLNSYVPMLRMLSSDNFYRHQYPVADLSDLYQKHYDNMIIPLQGGDGVEVSFDYFNWPIFFDVNSDGNTIAPQSLSTHYWVLHFGMQHYYTVYSLSYPVLVTVRDPDAFNGEGYTFTFALESNIRNNQLPADAEVLPPKVSPRDSLLCDENTYETGILKTIVVDSATADPLETVQVGFTIPEHDTCVMGLTGSQGTLESEYPAVYGGLFTFIKEGYLTTFAPGDTYDLKNTDAVVGYAGANGDLIQMHKFEKIKVGAKKKTIDKCVTEGVSQDYLECLSGSGLLLPGYCEAQKAQVKKEKCFNSEVFGNGDGEVLYEEKVQGLPEIHKWQYTGGLQALSPDESAIIMFKRVGDQFDQVFHEEFATAATITGDEPIEIDLVPGIYEVTATQFLNKEIIIPKSERCGEGLIEQAVCFDMDEVDLDSFVAGQILWEAPLYHLRITPEQLYNSGRLEFYIPSMNIEAVPPNFRILEDLEAMADVGNFSQLPTVFNTLTPRFK